MATLTEMNAEHNLLTKAFDLVKPSTHWKDVISAYVPAHALVEAGVTIEDVARAVIHFTATEADVNPLSMGAFFVQAKGYRAGPAGDH